MIFSVDETKRRDEETRKSPIKGATYCLLRNSVVTLTL